MRDFIFKLFIVLLAERDFVRLHVILGNVLQRNFRGNLIKINDLVALTCLCSILASKEGSFAILKLGFGHNRGRIFQTFP